MNQDIGELCRSVKLTLFQGDFTAEVLLSGDVLSEDCLILSSSKPFFVGSPAKLDVTFLEQSFSVEGKIKSASDEGDHYQLQFSLGHHDSLQTRMLLQLSEIEQYREQEALGGRALSIDEAAREWVGKFAEKFAEDFDSHQ